MFNFLLRFFIFCLCCFGAVYFVSDLILFLEKCKIKKHRKPYKADVPDDSDKAADLLKGSVSDDTYKR